MTLLIDQDGRTATVTVKGPTGDPPTTKEALREQTNQAPLDERRAAFAAEKARLAERLAALGAGQLDGRIEQIKRGTLLPQEWLPAGDELTPTSKLRRRPIAAKYAADIEALYAG